VAKWEEVKWVQTKEDSKVENDELFKQLSSTIFHLN
jgi:hypothetical protein